MKRMWRWSRVSVCPSCKIRVNLADFISPTEWIACEVRTCRFALSYTPFSYIRSVGNYSPEVFPIYSRTLGVVVRGSSRRQLQYIVSGITTPAKSAAAAAAVGPAERLECTYPKLSHIFHILRCAMHIFIERRVGCTFYACERGGET